MKKIIIATALCAATGASAATTVNTYGFVKASYMMADKIVGSDRTTESVQKPFFANDDSATDPEKEAKSYISSTNSRWGMNANNGSRTSAKFEFDLDAGQTNGAASMSNARVRQAHLSYKASENGTITFGKKWTKFMGVLPETIGFTRVNFWAGNTGFLVDGFDYTHKMGMTDFAIELANSSDDANLVSTPTATIVVNHKMGEHKIGLAYTTAELKHKSLDEANNKDSSASGTKVYWAGKYNSINVNLEYTMGSNLGSIHTGALGRSSNTSDDEIKETAYFLSVKYTQPEWNVYGGYGVDTLDKEEEAGNTGVSKNALMTIGFNKTLDEGLTFFVEQNAFTTSHYDSTDEKSEDSNGSLTEIGMLYKF
ncbi:MAG: hypothetical protein ACJAS4_002423 [Bacteriovoracaceae bacterium]